LDSALAWGGQLVNEAGIFHAKGAKERRDAKIQR
jgi:hypothetical protein